jgi:hypothetical protein
MQGDPSFFDPGGGAKLQFQHGILPNWHVFSRGVILGDTTFSDYLHLSRQQAEASPM